MTKSPYILIALLTMLVACTPRSADDNAAVSPAQTGAEPGAVGTPAVASPDANDRSIVPGQRLGAVTAASTHAQLEAAYGASNAQRANWPGAEGEEVPATVLFKDSDDEAWVLWMDEEANKLAAVIVTGGNWTHESGLRVGLSLAELVQANGGDFEFSGFGWDYGGRVTSWKGGRLAAFEGGPLSVQLGYDSEQTLDSKLEQQTLGDQTVQSSLPGINALKARVSQIDVGLQN